MSAIFCFKITLVEFFELEFKIKLNCGSLGKATVRKIFNVKDSAKYIAYTEIFSEVTQIMTNRYTST